VTADSPAVAAVGCSILYMIFGGGLTGAIGFSSSRKFFALTPVRRNPKPPYTFSRQKTCRDNSVRAGLSHSSRNIAVERKYVRSVEHRNVRSELRRRLGRVRHEK
jgi:hypothetical protein